MLLPSPFQLDLTGFSTALPTHFNAAGAIDLQAFEALCARQIACGATGLVVCSVTGEMPTLTASDYRCLIHTAVKIARGRVAVIASVGTNATAQAVDYARDAARLGADALLCVSPYYNKPSQAGIQAHVRAIAHATALPILLHDIPSRCAVGLTDATIGELAGMTQIIGLVDASGDVARPGRLRKLVRSDFQLLSGHDPTLFAYMALGGTGGVSVAANVLPRLVHSLVTALRYGRLDEAQGLAAPLNQFAALLDGEPEPVMTKYVLSLLNLMRPDVRLPLVSVNEGRKDEILESLRRISYLLPDRLVHDATPDHHDQEIHGLPLQTKSRAEVCAFSRT